jgi:hypothetical protein
MDFIIKKLFMSSLQIITKYFEYGQFICTLRFEIINNLILIQILYASISGHLIFINRNEPVTFLKISL